MGRGTLSTKLQCCFTLSTVKTASMWGRKEVDTAHFFKVLHSLISSYHFSTTSVFPSSSFLLSTSLSLFQATRLTTANIVPTTKCLNLASLLPKQAPSKYLKDFQATEQKTFPHLLSVPRVHTEKSCFIFLKKGTTEKRRQKSRWFESYFNS